ncbi:MAG: hypothetical protein PHI79_02255 [Sulfurovaceae bacterium]|nr:hypothetical protein [Sulfurovaceae bacterium]MDD5548399.1 hypothetical protein [Sulfurovaceae bacterium]
MKKTLLLSMVASSILMAGGDIAPVEPAVETPAVVPATDSGWKFSGQGVFYYQTMKVDNVNFFDQEAASANAGIQLRAVNKDLVAGVGVGVELSGIGTLGLDEDVVAYPMQSLDSGLNGGWVSQLYLTYGFGNTAIKVGRQELPKSLSPFAYSEDWNVFKNTFDAALVVNNDIPNTTVALAYVKNANLNGTASSDDWFSEYDYFYDINDFNSVANGAYMLTVQNKSIENLTLTGTYYDIRDFARIFWADAAYDTDSFNVGLQGGTFSDKNSNGDWKAYGIKAGTSVGPVNLMAAYSVIDPKVDGWMYQVGGTTSPLYTDMIADEILSGYYLRYPYDTGINVKKYKVAANMDLLGGNISTAYGVAKGADYNGVNPSDEDLKEFDLSYTRNVANDISLTATYANISTCNTYENGFDLLRFVARYNF